MSPEAYPRALYNERASRSRREERRRIFTGELARRVYGHTQHYPGTIRLSDLRLAPRGRRWEEYEIYGFSYITYPPDDWGPFYFGHKGESIKLDKVERKNFSTALKIAMDTGFKTIQQIRDASLELLQEGLPTQEFRGKTKLSFEKAAFLKKAFGPEVKQEQE